ncbi:alpha/beta hydrolase domain-containing protein 17A [Suricata suricatta]|uniref:alpha/beta hydrolase domain-containing protein 17A n=1 Tax=Suricata suricatta TaxID=37032 RepID=UPI001155F1BD|nr:alpha/beta hydrolase domain-containing protein 17A [Suricata suricatta]
MNGLSVSELCCLFCCPPCPGRIAAKLAFLPPEPTYSLVPEPEPGPGERAAACAEHCGQPLVVLRRAVGPPCAEAGSLRPLSHGGSLTLCWPSPAPCPSPHSQRSLSPALVPSCLVPLGSLPGPLTRPRHPPLPRYTLLFSHGNAVDLGQMSSFYIGLGSRINCNIFSYDYSGYGVSSGKPSEKNLYADIDAAWQALRARYGISPDSIVLYGQSIGTVPTVDLASRYECAAVVLHSPLTSGMRVAFPDTKKTYCFDAFPNIEKVSKITSPVLIIHGTEDEVIDFSHGLALYERCPKAVEPLWVEGAGHNDIELYSQYLERLRRFISQELQSQRA